MTMQMSEGAASVMRRLWFEFVDTAEPLRPKLHAYCLRLTGSLFDAEDLAQETMVRAFGGIGQGDISAGASPISNLGGYLARIATNLWIDRQRQAARAAAFMPDDSDAAQPAIVTPAAARALFERAAPQERAAVVLKDVFDFSLEETAVILATSVGAVKSALHRGRGKLAAQRQPAGPRVTAAPPELVARFIAAFNARDVPALTALLAADIAFEARGVGGERGYRGAIWIDANMSRPPRAVSWESAVVDGEMVALVMAPPRTLVSVSRLEADDGVITRHVTYFFCPDTVRAVATELGLKAATAGYHQDRETMVRMIADARLPWAGAQGRW
jgi:RNA polymerase sigma-70 factor (ECF subfamily)